MGQQGVEAKQETAVHVDGAITRCSLQYLLRRKHIGGDILSGANGQDFEMAVEEMTRRRLGHALRRLAMDDYDVHNTTLGTVHVERKI